MTHEVEFKVICSIETIDDEDTVLTTADMTAQAESVRLALVRALDSTADIGFTHPMEDELFLWFDVSRTFKTERGSFESTSRDG